MRSVKLKVSFAGQNPWPAGSIQLIEDREAERIVDAGFGEYVDNNPVEERQMRVEKPQKRR